MNLVFDIIQVSSFSINDSISCDYSLNIEMNLVKYQLSQSQNHEKEFLKLHFDEIKDSNYSLVTINSGSDKSKIKFKCYGIELQIEMTSDKLFKLYDEMSKTEFTHRFLKIYLSEDEMNQFPTREEIEDDVDKNIFFKNYKFEFITTK